MAWRGRSRRLLGKDAAAALLGSIGFGLLVHRLEDFLQNHFHALALFSFDSPDSIATAAPAISAVAGALIGVLAWAAAAAAIALAVLRLKPRWLVPVGLLAVLSLVPGDVRTAPEFALHFGMALMTASFAALWCWRFARNNYLAYALVFWIMELQGNISNLLGTAIPAMQIQGWILVAVAAGGVIWVVLPGFMRRDQVSNASAWPPVA